jgi:hypothetical protein
VSRAIRFTKEQREAVARALDAASVAEGRKDRATVKGLQSLLERMDAASLPPQPAQSEANERLSDERSESSSLSVKDFLDAMGEVFKPHQMFYATTNASYGRMAAMLKRLGWTREDAVDTARFVKGWWRRGPVNLHTILTRGEEWLAGARHQALPGHTHAVHSLFDGEGDE